MAIICFDKEEVLDYVPEYAGNRSSDSPCIVRLRFVPYARVQHYSRLIAARTKAGIDASRAAEVAQGVQRTQFVENVESVDNYYVGNRSVTSAAEFYDTADTDLILEVIRAMESQSRLSEGQRKNS